VLEELHIHKIKYLSLNFLTLDTKVTHLNIKGKTCQRKHEKSLGPQFSEAFLGVTTKA
jgi:hypothetical protein